MERSEEVKVGLFVVGAVVLLVLALVLVGGLNLFQQPRNRYTVRTHFAGGIEEGAPVRYAGMKVGRVDKLALDPQDASRAVISLSVYPETPVHADSTAKVTSLGMLGENYIEITPGEDPKAQPLPSGSEILAKDSVQWGELVDQFGGATDEAKALLQEDRPLQLRELERQDRQVHGRNQSDPGEPGRAARELEQPGRGRPGRGAAHPAEAARHPGPRRAGHGGDSAPAGSQPGESGRHPGEHPDVVGERARDQRHRQAASLEPHLEQEPARSPAGGGPEEVVASGARAGRALPAPQSCPPPPPARPACC